MASAARAPGFRCITELIGGTPLVRLKSVVPARVATIYAKCEHMNPGGSVKDRIALAMVEAAEADGRLKPGYAVIEPTSGNTGIALALVCRAKGYRCKLTMPESMSLERRALLKSYGAELILTPEADYIEGAIARAQEIAAKDPQVVLLQQFENPANPAVHMRTTGPEIVAALEKLGGPAPGRVSAFVAAVGTGGTISGVGRFLRSRDRATRVVAVEPRTHNLLSGGKPNPHRIQGIGAGFIPPILDRSVIDEVRAVSDHEAYVMKKRLAREEGLLVGISSGANVAAAVEVAYGLGPGATVVTVLCDTGERYFSMDTYFQ
jgi:cysteine synthase A